MAFGVEDIYLWKKKGRSGIGQRVKSNWYSGLTECWPTHLGVLGGTLSFVCSPNSVARCGLPQTGHDLSLSEAETNGRSWHLKAICWPHFLQLVVPWMKAHLHVCLSSHHLFGLRFNLGPFPANYLSPVPNSLSLANSRQLGSRSKEKPRHSFPVTLSSLTSLLPVPAGTPALSGSSINMQASHNSTFHQMVPDPDSGSNSSPTLFLQTMKWS